MATGVVKWFDEEKGFGFIAQHDPDEPDLFVHYSGIAEGYGRRMLVEGQQVEFDIDRRPAKGPMAVDVRPAANDSGRDERQERGHGG
ncbi:cold-shock protein [Nocardia wallacei]|uniref:cold-shock protein n=1 Tax=Nocardia wallacei TaxID=480035 RepID=UPI0024558B76|nr:cold-shock protein [Nocardia wallacei]